MTKTIHYQHKLSQGTVVLKSRIIEEWEDGRFFTLTYARTHYNFGRNTLGDDKVVDSCVGLFRYGVRTIYS